MLALAAVVGATLFAAPIEHALPGSCRSALYVRDASKDLERSVDAMERLLNSEEALAFVDSAPFPSLVLQALTSGAEVGIDPHAGLALFRPEHANVAVGVAAVTDEARMYKELARALTRRGGAPKETVSPDGRRDFHLADGVELTAFINGGFVYLVMPDVPFGLPGDQQAGPADLTAAVAELRSTLSSPLDAAAQFQLLMKRVAHGTLIFFAHAPPGQGGAIDQGLASMSFDETAAHVDAFVATAEPLLTPTASLPALLDRVPPEATILLSSDVKLPEVPRWLGAMFPWTMETARSAGLPVEVLAASFAGPMQAAFYLDPELFVLDAVSGEDGIGPIGTVLAEAAPTNASAAKELLAQWMGDNGLRVRSEKLSSRKSRIRTRLYGQPVEVTFEPARVSLRAGPVLTARPTAAAAAIAKQRLPAGAFGPGHLSFAADIARARALLDKPAHPDDLDFTLLQRSVRAVLAEATSVDWLGFDVSSEDAGLRLRAELLYRPILRRDAGADAR